MRKLATFKYPIRFYCINDKITFSILHLKTFLRVYSLKSRNEAKKLLKESLENNIIII